MFINKHCGFIVYNLLSAVGADFEYDPSDQGLLRLLDLSRTVNFTFNHSRPCNFGEIFLKMKERRYYFELEL